MTVTVIAMTDMIVTVIIGTIEIATEMIETDTGTIVIGTGTIVIRIATMTEIQEKADWMIDPVEVEIGTEMGRRRRRTDIEIDMVVQMTVMMIAMAHVQTVTAGKIGGRVRLTSTQMEVQRNLQVEEICLTLVEVVALTGEILQVLLFLQLLRLQLRRLLLQVSSI